MKHIGTGRASALAVGAVGAVLALVSGCASSPDPVVRSSTPATATTGAVPTTQAPRPHSDLHVSSAKLGAKQLTIELVGPQAATFRVQAKSGTITVCKGRPGPLDKSGAIRPGPEPFQHYTVTCAGMSDDTKLTLLVVAKPKGSHYNYETPLTVTS